MGRGKTGVSAQTAHVVAFGDTILGAPHFTTPFIFSLSLLFHVK
jgi:hypothetical protein